MSTPNEYEIAIIGPQDTVSGFAALGVRAIDANTGADALERLREIGTRMEADGGEGPRFAVVCLIEELMADVDPDEVARATRGALPAVVLLPGPAGSQGVALARLRRLAEQAVGSAII